MADEQKPLVMSDVETAIAKALAKANDDFDAQLKIMRAELDAHGETLKGIGERLDSVSERLGLVHQTAKLAANAAYGAGLGDTTKLPPWHVWALGEYGQRETGNNAGPAVERYIKLSKCGQVGDPWCAIFVNAALEAVGIRGTRSASSQSFRHDPRFVALEGPAVGAITVYWRGEPDSGKGHVGFYCSETAGQVDTLGGNEGDKVQRELLPKNSKTFGLIGYYWPAAYPLPQIGAVRYSGKADADTAPKVV